MSNAAPSASINWLTAGQGRDQVKWRKFEPNTAISSKQFYLGARTLYLLSMRDRCKLGPAPCGPVRSVDHHETQTSSLSVSPRLDILGRWLCATGFLLSGSGRTAARCNPHYWSAGEAS